MSDYEFIREFTKIRINDICNELGFSSSNISSGKVSEEKLKKVKYAILKRLLKIMIEDKKDDLIIIYLYNEIIEKLEKENKLLREMI